MTTQELSDLPNISVDLTKSPAYNVLSIVEVDSKKQVEALGKKWNKGQAEVLRQNYLSRLFTTIPKICPGVEICKRCPLPNPDMYQGCGCAVEINEVFRLAAGYINSLQIMPEEHAAIEQVMNLVRLSVMIQRFDQDIATHGYIIDTPAMVVQSTGQMITRRELAASAKAQLEYMQQQEKILKSLLATRESKASLKKTKNLGALFANLGKDEDND